MYLGPTKGRAYRSPNNAQSYGTWPLPLPDATRESEDMIALMATHKSGTIRLLLIENRLIVRAGLRMLIESWSNMAIIGEASSDDTPLALAESLQPDVILISVDLHGNSNLNLLPKLIMIAPRARVLLLTSIADPELHWRGVQLGVMGVVLKEQPPEVLHEAIKRVHAGEVWLGPFYDSAAGRRVAQPTQR